MIEPSYRPVDVATGWAYSLTDPLLPLRRRAVFEEAMGRVAGSHPRWAEVYLAGAVTVIAATLPPSDPWRHLRARVGQVCVGGSIDGLEPGQDAVVSPDGNPFGTWRDATDLLQPVFDEPESDPQLAALAEPLPTSAAAVLAAAGRGDWRQTLLVLRAAVDTVPHLSRIGGSGGDPQVSRGYSLRDIGRAALVWAIHRRRAYIGWDDPVVVENLLAWASRAGRVVATEPEDPAGWTEQIRGFAGALDQTVLRGIDRDQLPDAARDGLDATASPTRPAGQPGQPGADLGRPVGQDQQ